MIDRFDRSGPNCPNSGPPVGGLLGLWATTSSTGQSEKDVLRVRWAEPKTYERMINNGRRWKLDVRFNDHDYDHDRNRASN